MSPFNNVIELFMIFKAFPKVFSKLYLNYVIIIFDVLASINENSMLEANF